MARSKTTEMNQAPEAPAVEEQDQHQEQVAEPTPEVVTIRGYLGADPVRRETSSGVAVANLSVAVHEGDDDNPTWHRVVLWRNNAEYAAKNLRLGNMVQVTGRPRTRSYTDKDGNERQVTEIVAFRSGLLAIGQVAKTAPVEYREVA